MEKEALPDYGEKTLLEGTDIPPRTCSKCSRFLGDADSIPDGKGGLRHRPLDPRCKKAKKTQRKGQT